ncbi:MAG: tRNA-dihydrouridine synthase family protein [Bacteroidales bacterium]|nr:tRNA-dihydrouridine synthase family protein [Bacteroidales bacterium]
MSTPLKIYLAPFQGITGHVYRRSFAKHFRGVDKFFTAFFTGIHKAKSLSSKAGEFETTHYNGIKLVPQILSKDAAEMLRFANFCHAKGFDEINWNLGCPYPRVANKKRGSGLVPHPEMVDEILGSLMPEIPIRLSVKTRLGYFSPDEILKLIQVLNRFPVSELIIHARIGKQLYKGGVNLSAFEHAAGASQIPLAYNGDIFSLDGFREFDKRFPETNTWMIGRGLLVDPFLPAIIKGLLLPELSQRKAIVRKFIDDLYFGYRKKMNDRPQAINVLKELWGFLCFSFDEPHRVFNLLKKTKSFDEYENAVNSIFEKHEWLGSVAGLFRPSG